MKGAHVEAEYRVVELRCMLPFLKAKRIDR